METKPTKVPDPEYFHDAANNERTIAEARAAVCSIIEDTDHTLLLDLDRPQDYWHFQGILPLLRETFPVRCTEEWPSKSGKGRHVVVHLVHPLPIASRLALQACLGSDPKRELLAVKRIETGVKPVSVLFRPLGLTV